MQRSAPQRPTSVAVIGWAAIGVGGLSVLSGVSFIAVAATMPPMDTFPPQPGMALPMWYFQHPQIIAAVQIVLAGGLTWAGARFLRLRPSSRRVLEIYAWAGLAFLLAVSASWVRTALSIRKMMSDQMSVSFPFGLFITAGLVMMLAFVAVNIVVIRTLRSSQVRDAFSAAQGAV